MNLIFFHIISYEENIDMVLCEMLFTLLTGGMAEWFKAAVLKTVVRKFRGFESYSLRHKYIVMER